MEIIQSVCSVLKRNDVSQLVWSKFALQLESGRPIAMLSSI